MGSTCRVKHVTYKLNNSAIRAIKQRTKAQLQSWALKVLRTKVELVTPVDTGRLRRSGDVLVEGGDQTRITWYWLAPYAGEVERMRESGKSPRTPGTIAPFAEPTIREAIEDEVSEPIGKAFGG